MNFKLNGFIFTAMFAAVGMITVTGTASAQDIPGEFFAANNSNTQTQVSRTIGSFSGTDFSNPNAQGTLFLPEGGFVNFWEERSSQALSGGNSLGSTAGYVGSGSDPAIVTTLTGLDAGTYDVEYIFVVPFGNEAQYQAGFSSTSTSSLLPTANFGGDTNPLSNRYLGASVPGASFLNVFGSPLGNTSVGADGTLSVYTEIDTTAFQNNNAGFVGLSLVQTSTAVPEPSSFALLGLLGGLGLIRRRR